ncbi:AAC_HP2_G0043120.mRNA.1.CDS.1 [Saccharomyces cerevisiae]|nr:ATV_HP_G0013420.mRNA.1.CDS.1 [Saccharomyces cerevisiae]CAI5095501.1 ATV_HP_G0037160.mRNA.1.CDS.1 [Saccharomyces cerevisiae]CAI5098298.1 ATV_HP_G0038080.mRNA.1.CDS.1 [Saccharomyces cerevisiae]CAI5318823.1 AAC_HP2_G0043120.mRNA.1.CDS.1 [Saccharomyces cerevisiae]CAI6719405.1 AAC_HP2_G0043120.mRNA.1.CDS.1 [Saccharomyces cerevisiae]
MHLDLIHKSFILVWLIYIRAALADQFTYKACYSASDIRKLGLTYKGVYEYQSVSYCQNECPGQAVVALFNGTGCYCGGSVAQLQSLTQVDSSKCDVSCAGWPYQNCGGSSAMNVYINNAASTADSTSSTATSTSTTSSSSTSVSSKMSTKLDTKTSTSSSATHSSSSSSTTSTTTSSSETTTSSSSSSSSSSTSTTSTTSTTSSTTSTSSSPSTTSSSTSASSSSETSSTQATSSSTTSTSSSTSTATVTSTPSSTSIGTSTHYTTRVVTQSVVSQANQQASTIFTTRTSVYATVSSTSSSTSSLLNGKSSSSKSKGLSGGAIAGVVVGVVCGTVALLALALFFFVWKKRRQSSQHVDLEETKQYQPYSLGDADANPVIPPSASSTNWHIPSRNNTALSKNTASTFATYDLPTRAPGGRDSIITGDAHNISKRSHFPSVVYEEPPSIYNGNQRFSATSLPDMMEERQLHIVNPDNVSSNIGSNVSDGDDDYDDAKDSNNSSLR